MLCGYCAADTQEGEEHTVQCQVFRFLTENHEIREDPYSGVLAAINAALSTAKSLNMGMSGQEYLNIRAIAFECEAADGDFHWDIP